MIKIKRLNLDSSWHIKFNKLNFVLDPWLIGSEIDGFKWLNEQWHIKPPVAIDDIPNYDSIIISQNYEDHCHIETLKRLPNDKSILATEKAYNKLKKQFPDREIIRIDTKNKMEKNKIKFISIKPPKIMDPIYFALLIYDQDNNGIFYAPHGFTLDENQKELVNKFKIKLMITTFTEFKLPKIMGGYVNPGMSNVYELYNQISPKYIINTHDEKKKAKGLVSLLAKIKYPDLESIENIKDFNFINIDNYKSITLN